MLRPRQIIGPDLIGRIPSYLPDSPVVVVIEQAEAAYTPKVLSACACGYTTKKEMRGT